MDTDEIDVPMVEDAGVQDQASLERREQDDSRAFDHFVWRRHRQASALYGFVPELLATDGRIVRRVVADDSGLVIQQFEDERTGAAIVEAVESNCADAEGLVGYSVFSECASLTIMHTGQRAERAWLAYPGEAVEGRPRIMPTLPMNLSDVPTARLSGAAQLEWIDCNLMLDAHLSQAPDAAGGELPSLAEHLASLEVRACVERRGESCEVALVEREREGDDIAVERAGHARARFAVDEVVFEQLTRDDEASAWMVVTVDRSLVCLPRQWRRWWFPIEVADPSALSGKSA